MKRLAAAAILAVVLLPLLVSACTNIQLGYSGSNVGNKLNASYQYFSGTRTKDISVKSGETILIQYSSEVEEGGLSMTVLDADGNVSETLSANTTGTAELQAAADEKFRLVIEGSQTRGNFEVSWDIR